MTKISVEPNWVKVHKFVMSLDDEAQKKFIEEIGMFEWVKITMAAEQTHVICPSCGIGVKL